MEKPLKQASILLHDGCENLGIIADALQHNGITPRYIRAFEGEPVPRK
jgi:hypothetical protein